jgi:isoleucyl-tRNA synthetase
MWGVPIALFTHKATGALHPQSAELLDRVADIVAKDGIDAWFDLDPKQLLGAEADQYEKVPDIMDVWFDSGALNYCLAKMRPEMTSPADLYLEGSDQHRGWFGSSLMTSTAIFKHAPYKTVLTHGFTVDDKGRKMSKSLGNVIAPQKIINSSGADVLRLWVAATDYANEMSLSDEILKRVSESYRRMRNTARYFLGSLGGFNPETDQVPVEQLVAVDRWALWRAQQLQDQVIDAYRKYEFHAIYQMIHNFCSVDMGGFYLDVVKDRMYTTPTTSHARRSGQTAMYWIVAAMARWLAPILSFTAEEIWKFLPGKHAESVFLSSWVEMPAAARTRPPVDWDTVLTMRSAVLGELEKLRATSAIGAPLDAEVDIYCSPALFDVVKPFGDELRFVLITSEAKAFPAEPRPADAVAVEVGQGNSAWIAVRASSSTKCIRCWNKRADVGKHAAHPELCGRCIGNLDGPGEPRGFA